MKQFSFWGDLLIFFVALPIGILLVPMPWDIIVMCIAGLIAGSLRESSSFGWYKSVDFKPYRKSVWFLAALLLIGVIWVAHYAIQRHAEERFSGLWFSYMAAQLMGVFLGVVREIANPTVEHVEETPVQSEPVRRPAPVVPKEPKMDSSGTFTFSKRNE